MLFRLIHPIIFSFYRSFKMFKNKSTDGKYNISGPNIKRIRCELQPKTSQRKLADRLQLYGLDVDKNAVQRIESGQRFVTDIELKAIANVLNVSLEILLDDKDEEI